MSDYFQLFREHIKTIHHQLENSGVFKRVSSVGVQLNDVEAFLNILFRFYSHADVALCNSPFHLQGLYQPRAALLETDLAYFGPIKDVPFVAPELVIKDKASWLGYVYAIEGSAAGGRYLIRHLKHQFPAFMKNKEFSFFQVIGSNYETHWPYVLTHIKAGLQNESDFQSASHSVTSMFEYLMSQSNLRNM